MKFIAEYPIRFVKELKEHTLFVQNINSVPVRIYVDKTGKQKLNGKDLAKALGYKDESEMLGSDEFLDIMNNVKKQTGKSFYSKINSETEL